jgi:uncharacterized membrane protein
VLKGGFGLVYVIIGLFSKLETLEIMDFAVTYWSCMGQTSQSY